VGSLRLGLGFVSVPSFLIVGAIAQPRFPRAGRVLICAGALALSVWVLVGALIPPINRPAGHLSVAGLSLASILVVTLCDLAIVMEEVRIRRTQIKQEAEIVSVSNQIRWLAGVTGCLTAVAGLPVLSLLSVVVSGFSIVGAAVAGRFPRHGRDLIWFGAVAQSLYVLPFGGMLLLSLRPGTDPRVTAVAAAAVLLVVLCDGALVTEAFKTRRAGRREKRNID
jgi:hypothetical protein